MTTRLRVGVVGGGLIAQAVHLPNLARLSDRFELAAIADPSPRVREALAARYAPARAYEHASELLERERLDAVVVCSPHATHAAVVLAALELGLHAFVEKPLCIDLDDADAICERAAATGKVVQVGYMKRFSRAYASLVDGLPDAPDGLRMIDVVTYDPWMAREPFVPWSSMTPADDVPDGLRAAAAEDERAQVARATGRDDPDSVRAYSYTFLACLVHDVNLVHGLLDRLGIAGPAEPRESAVWAGGDAASASLALPGGALWRTSWMLLRGLMDFDERARLYFEDAIHELELPAPYHTDAPARHRVTTGAGGVAARSERAFVDDPYLAELEHFHDCVVGGDPCRTPPEQARRDMAVLRELFRVRGETTRKG
jgi:predicted dehydrogenase